MAVNGDGAGNVAAAAAERGASVVYVSSDYVFDGAKGEPYVETDQPAPLSAYGRTKLAGEEATTAANKRHFVVRSSWLFGIGGGNFVETMLRLAADHGEVLVVRDQVGSPTYTWHLAYGLVRLIEGVEFGIHHMAAAGSCSWYEFAREIFEQAKVECKVLSATTEMLGRPAPRPRLLGPDQPARARDPSAVLAGRPRRLHRPAQRRARGRQHEDPRHRRGGLHRLDLRAAGRRGARGAGARQADLRRPAREPARGYRARRRRYRGPEDRPRGDGGLRSGRQLRRRVPRRPLDRRPGGLCADPRDRDRDAARRRPRAGHRALPAGLDRRGLRLDRVGLVHRDLAARPVLAVLGDEGRRRPAGLGPRPHLRDRGVDRPRLQQLRAAPIPGEVDSADGPQRDPRRPAAGVRGWARRSATGSTSRTSAAASTPC